MPKKQTSLADFLGRGLRNFGLDRQSQAQLAANLGNAGRGLLESQFGSPVAPIPQNATMLDKAVHALSYPGVMPIGATVYHGTPHRFPPTPKNPLGEFDLSKIGTGEGAQAFGHGLYFAESPGVAKSYQQALSNRSQLALDSSGKPLAQHGFSSLPTSAPAAHHAAASAASTSGGAAGAIASLRAQLAKYRPESLAAYKRYKATGNIEHPGFTNTEAGRKQAKKQFDQMDFVNEQIGWLEDNAQNIQTPDPGAFYKADLPDEAIPRMLDWDAPLSQQPEAVIKAIQGTATYKDRLAGHKAGRLKHPDEATGSMWYSFLQDETPEWRAMGDAAPGVPMQRSVSNMLRNMGIPGIKYLDQGSRAGGKGTRNFVVWEPKALPTIQGVE